MNNYSFKLQLFLQFFLASILVETTFSQFNAAENVPVEFYGEVSDQNGQPVVGAKIAFDFIVSHMAENRTETKPMILQTDESGKFVLTGVTGYAIDKLSIRKQGYELSPKTRRGYVFGLDPDYHPSLSHPVVFTMWKQQGKEPLVGSSWRGKIFCNGETNRFELHEGKPATKENLEISCLRDPVNYEPTNRESYAYKMVVSLIGGGIQPTSDEFTYRAPESGYMPSITLDREPGDPQWRAGVDQEFYIKTADGHYGQISIVWDAGHRPPPTVMRWECVVNPSGSRNLER